MEKEFRINDYLSVKLEGLKTFIYIKGIRFRQCKYVLLNIPVDNIDQHFEINSIDEVINNLDNTLEQHLELISPEVEFWSHCSNLQAWAENNYNTDLLDTNLSFPILKTLYLEGDPIAIKAFKEEMVKRLIRGGLDIIDYLTYHECLKFLTYEELTLVLNSEDCSIFERIFNAFKSPNFEKFSMADRLYNNIGKYLYASFKKKIKHILQTENLEDLCIVFKYSMIKIFSDEEIMALLNPPLNLLERTLKIFNKNNNEDNNLDIGLLSEKVRTSTL